MKELRIGTCGYQYYDPGEGWKDEYESKLAAYSHAFQVGELNRTFYDLPQVSTAERWRREAACDFEFTIKAWQAITHPWESPTWNNHRDGIQSEKTDSLGYLQPTEAIREAWGETRGIAEALEATMVILQTPPSFDCTDEHESNMRELLGEIDRGDLTIGWEPRGDWPENPSRIKQLCEDLELVHVVDIMRDEPVTTQGVLYSRLHGLNADPYDYDYDYTDDELDTLAEKLSEYAKTNDAYCLFNNFEMYNNAASLIDRLP